MGWHIKIHQLTSKYKSGLLYTRLHAKVSKATLVSRVCNLCYRTILHCKTEHNSDTYLKTYTVATVTQLGKFSQNLEDLTQPLRQLLSKQSAWLWGAHQERAFKSVKEELAKPTTLAHYDPQAPARVSADASSYGLGAVLMQRVDLKWKPVAYTSRTMTETEK